METEREKVRRLLLLYYDKHIRDNGVTIIMRAAQPPKNEWTNQEYRDAVFNDTTLENTNINPIDSALRYGCWSKITENDIESSKGLN